MILLYFLMHLRAFIRVAESVSEEQAWIGIYDDSLAKTLTIVSVFILPIITCCYIYYNEGMILSEMLKNSAITLVVLVPLYVLMVRAFLDVWSLQNN
ncbi:MAG: hypothetical protein QM500_04455 [Methylococcales bacterium]